MMSRRLSSNSLPDSSAKRVAGLLLLAAVGGCTSLLGDFSVGDAGADASPEASTDATLQDVATTDAPTDAPTDTPTDVPKDAPTDAPKDAAIDMGVDAPACGAINQTCCSGNPSCNTGSCCGTVCLDTSNDSKNCGSCGHQCIVGGCTNGLCTPQTIYTSISGYPGRIRDAQSYLVWMDRDNTDGGQAGRVLVCDKQACSPTVLMQGLDWLTDIVLDTPTLSTVYASNASQTLYSCAVTGCNQTPTKTTVGTNSGTQGLAYRNGYLYSTLNLDAWQFLPDGGTVAELGTGNEPGNSFEAPPGSLYVYWNNGQSGTYEIRVGKDSTASSAVNFWSTTSGYTSLIASDATYVAWSSTGSSGSNIYACPVGPGPCNNPTTIASNVQNLGYYEGALSIDPSNDDVLWTAANGNEVKVFACPASLGCGSSPRLLADVKTTSTATAGAVMADSSFYYFDMSDGTNETLYRVAR